METLEVANHQVIGFSDRISQTPVALSIGAISAPQPDLGPFSLGLTGSRLAVMNFPPFKISSIDLSISSVPYRPPLATTTYSGVLSSKTAPVLFNSWRSAGLPTT